MGTNSNKIDSTSATTTTTANSSTSVTSTTISTTTTTDTNAAGQSGDGDEVQKIPAQVINTTTKGEEEDDDDDDLIYMTVPDVKLPDLIKLGNTKITLNEENINLVYAKGGVYAMTDRCPHAGGPLHLGDIEDLPNLGLCIKCPWHLWKFSLTTGTCIYPGPRNKSLKLYSSIKINDGDGGSIQIGFKQISPTYFTTPPE